MNNQTAGKRIMTGVAGLALCVGLAIPGVAMIQAAPSQPGQAQPADHGHEWGHKHKMDPDRQAKHLTKRLGLSADQEAQLKPILADRDQQIQAVHGDSSIAAADRHAKVAGILESSNSKIETILNEEQKQKFSAMLSERQERMREHRHGGDSTAATPQS